MSQKLTSSGPFRKMVTGISLFCVVCVVAVVGYVAAGWPVADSIYMVIITIFGVGYGEVQPVQSTELRALTIVVIISGYAAVIYTVGGFMQMVIDGELNSALGARRMSREIDRLENHTIICGFGRMGRIIARELSQSGKPFVVIDADERQIHAAEESGYLCITGDATEEHVLAQAKIQVASVVATVLSQDSTNVFITITARAMNPNATIIARGENPRTENKLLGCGAKKVVLPTAIGAKRIVQLITRPSAEGMLEQFAKNGGVNEDLGQIGLQFNELEVRPESALAGRPLSNIEVRSNHGFLIVGIRRADGSTILNPSPETQLSEGDTVVVIGHNDDIPELAERFMSPSSRITYRGVTMER